MARHKREQNGKAGLYRPEVPVPDLALINRYDCYREREIDEDLRAKLIPETEAQEQHYQRRLLCQSMEIAAEIRAGRRDTTLIPDRVYHTVSSILTDYPERIRMMAEYVRKRVEKERPCQRK